MNRRRFILLVTVLISFLLVSCESNKKIQIGATFPLTGNNALYGTNIKNGIELALDEINKAGGIDGNSIEVIYYDDINEPTKAVNNLQELASVHKVPAVIGSAGSNCTLAMASIANNSKTVILSPTSSQPEVTDAGPFVFRSCPSDVFQVNIIVDWILQMGYKKVGVLFVTNSWGVALQRAFEKSFIEKGGNIIASEGVGENETNFKSQLTKLSRLKPDALFMPTYARQGGRAVKQAKELRINFPLFGGDPWDVGEFITSAGDAANGCMYTVFSQYKGKEYQQFETMYKTKYKTDPDFLAASGYDDMYLIANAMKYLAKQGKEISGDNIRIALNEMPTYIGATGDNTFDENGDVIKKVFEKKIYKNLKSVEFKNDVEK